MTLDDFFAIGSAGLVFGFAICFIVCMLSVIVGWLLGILRRI